MNRRTLSILGLLVNINLFLRNRMEFDFAECGLHLFIMNWPYFPSETSISERKGFLPDNAGKNLTSKHFGTEFDDCFLTPHVNSLAMGVLI